MAEIKQAHASSQTTDPEKAMPEIGTVAVERHGLTDRVDNLSDVQASTGWFAGFTKATNLLRAEERGIERVDEADRVDQSFWDGFTMWASANLK
jgi:hypothetical protein